MALALTLALALALALLALALLALALVVAFAVLFVGDSARLAHSYLISKSGECVLQNMHNNHTQVFYYLCRLFSHPTAFTVPQYLPLNAQPLPLQSEHC